MFKHQLKLKGEKKYFQVVVQIHDLFFSPVTCKYASSEVSMGCI